MSANHVVELIPGFALGSLDDAEAARVELHLEKCRSCQAELDAYTALAANLALAAPDAAPPAHLKARLMDRIQAGSPAPAVSKPETGWRAWLRAAQQSLAVPRWQPVALILIFGLVISSFLVRQQITRQDQSGNIPKDTIVLTGTDAAPAATGLIVVSTDGHHGTLIVENLPDLGPEQQYQLWLVRDGQRTSGAIFSVSEEGYSAALIDAEQALADFQTFGITIEPAGGSPGPTGAKVLGNTP